MVTADGHEVPHDGETLGEIVARGNVVMEGYYRDPQATAAVIRDGWFHSGDAAVVHPDGYVEIRDRIKDVIISGGENISSVEVEAALLAHPAVMEAGVVGLPHEKWGEAPHAFVVLKPGASSTPGRTARILPLVPRALQGAARLHVRRRSAADGDGEDSEVRAAEEPAQHGRAVTRCTREAPRGRSVGGGLAAHRGSGWQGLRSARPGVPCRAAAPRVAKRRASGASAVERRLASF